MNWKSILMMGLMQAPGIVSAIDGIKSSGAGKREQALAGVMLGMNAFQSIDPQDFTRVFSNPKVQEAIALANDHIHFALKTVDTVAAGLPATSAPPKPNTIIWGDSPEQVPTMPPANVGVPKPNSIIWDNAPAVENQPATEVANDPATE